MMNVKEQTRWTTLLQINETLFKGKNSDHETVTPRAKCLVHANYTSRFNLLYPYA